MGINNTNRCIFLDRDGVINEDRVNYAYDLSHFKMLEGVPESIKALKEAGFLVVVVTNQSGIAQGIYTREQMNVCHAYVQQACNHQIDHFYYSPLHPKFSESLMRKPGTLMFEKAIARFNIDAAKSWMVGDRTRDIIPARKMGIKTIQIGHEVELEHKADFQADDLKSAVSIILSVQHG